MVDLGPTHFLQFCIQWSSIALLYYDYVLTFPAEVRYIWQEKFKLSSALYICCRYALVSNVVYLLALANKLDCDKGYFVAASFSILGRFAVITVWSARTYAVYSRNRYVLLFFGSIGLACIILQIVSCSIGWKSFAYIPVLQVHVPIVSCEKGSSMPIGETGFLKVAQGDAYKDYSWWTNCRIYGDHRIHILGFDCISVHSSLENNGWLVENPEERIYIPYTRTRSFVLCVGGTITEQSNCVLIYPREITSAVSILAVSSLVLNVSIPGGFFQRLLNAFNLPVSCMLTARFLLHLRHWEARQYAEGSTSRSYSRSEITPELDIQPGTIASVVEEFGTDPVRISRRERHGRQAASNGTTTDSGFPESFVRR